MYFPKHQENVLLPVYVIVSFLESNIIGGRHPLTIVATKLTRHLAQPMDLTTMIIQYLYQTFHFHHESSIVNHNVPTKTSKPVNNVNLQLIKTLAQFRAMKRDVNYH